MLLQVHDCTRKAIGFFLITIGLAYGLGLIVVASIAGYLPFTLPAAAAIPVLYSPAIAALALSVRDGAVRSLFAPLLKVRVGWLWYAVALGLPVLTNIFAIMLSVQITGTELRFIAELPPEFPDMGAAIYIVLPVYFIMASLGEELGWRGYALPRLQVQYSGLLAAAIVGTIWTAWHLPLFWLGDTAQAQIPVGWYPAYVLGLSVLFTWIYNSTAGSLLLVTLFHASIQLANLLLPVLPHNAKSELPFVLSVVIIDLIAAVIVIVNGSKSLSGARRRTLGH